MPDREELLIEAARRGLLDKNPTLKTEYDALRSQKLTKQKATLPAQMQHPKDMSVGEQLKVGLEDPYYAVAQMGAHATGRGDAVDQEIAKRERDIRQRSPGGVEGGFLRAAGNPVNWLTGGRAGAAKSIGSAIGRSAFAGAAGSAMEPVVNPGDFATDKAIQTATGGAVGAGLGTVSGAAKSALGRTASQGELAAVNKTIYDQLRNSNLTLNGSQFRNVVGIVEQQLMTQPFRPYLHPQTFAVLDEMKAHPGNVTMGDIQSFEQLLKAAGGTPGDREAARQTRQLFAHYFENLPNNHVIAGDPKDVQMLREASANYRQLKRSEAIDLAPDRAKRKAAVSGTANEGNDVRRQLNNILNSETESRKYSADELAKIRKIVDGTLPINALRYIGKFAPTDVLHSIPTALAAASGAGAGPSAAAKLGAAVAVPTLAAKAGANMATKGQAHDLAQSMLRQAPHYQKNPPPTPGWWLRGPASLPAALSPAGSELGSALAPQSDALGPQSLNEAPLSEVLSDASPDPVRAGQHFAMADEPPAPVGEHKSILADKIQPRPLPPAPVQHPKGYFDLPSDKGPTRPAVRLGKEIYEGQHNHDDALNEMTMHAPDVDLRTHKMERGFVTPSGRFYLSDESPASGKITEPLIGGKPLLRDVLEVTAKGRSKRTEPLPVGNEAAILQRAEQRLSEGPRLVPRDKLDATLRQNWEKHGPERDYDFGNWKTWDKEVKAWNAQHPASPMPEGDYTFGTNKEFESIFDARHLKGRREPYQGAKKANEYFEDANPKLTAYGSRRQIPDEWLPPKRQ